MAVVNEIANNDATDWNIFLQGSSDADKHERVEVSKFLMRLAGDETGGTVARRRDGMHNKPVACWIGKATVLVKSALLSDQQFRIGKMSFHREALVSDAREDECAPRMGAEFFPHVSWSAIDHFLRLNEFEFAGYLQEAPVPVIRGAVTGLPIPANAELVVEGEFPPMKDEEMAPEGPFGEWPGYFTEANVGETPMMVVKRVYYRNDPIVLGAPPLKPPASYLPIPLGAATLWEQLEKAGIPDVKGVWGFVYGGQPGPFTVIAIKQRYAGHSKQALLVAAGARAGAYGGKFVVVVDEDIDITNPADVLWAIATRCHVREGVDVVKGVWASVCEPALPPEERSPRGYTSDRVLIDACRPYKWMEQFPPVNAFTKDFKDQVQTKWKM